MRYFLLIILVSIVCVGARGESLPDVIDKVRGSIVGIGTMYPSRQPNIKGNTSSLHGTGFVVGGGLQIVTNAHVLPQDIDSDNKQTLAIFAGRGQSVKAYPAKVVKVDEMHDLAILEFRGDPLPSLALGDSSLVREGQKVAFTGFPIGAVLGLFPVTHRGIVSVITPMARPADGARSLSAVQLRRMRNPFDAFQLDATAYPGNSGSPVYEPNTGKVIGILNSVFVKESRETILERPSGISYAIPVVHLQEMLQKLPRNAVK